jgi:hypothetical protein
MSVNAKKEDSHMITMTHSHHYHRVLLLAAVFFLLTGVLWSGNTASTGEPGKTEKEKIIAVVNQFFEILETRNVELAKKILIPEGFSFNLRETGKETVLKKSGFKTFIEELPGFKGRYKEVMSNPKVLIHKGIAMLWADYKFYINGNFSHCGVDAFSLIKTHGEWKICGVIYTVEKSGN